MKNIFLLLCISMGLLFLINCKKSINEEDKKMADDPRKKYLGDYKGVKTYERVGFCDNEHTEDTIIVKVSLGYTDSTLLVGGTEVVLSKDGRMYRYGVTNYMVSMGNDSLNYSLYEGTPACSTRSWFFGSKIK